MIKIENIRPIDRKSPYKVINDLEKDFIVRMRLSPSAETYLENFAKTGFSRKYKLTSKQLLIINYLRKNFSKVILSRPIELHQIIKHFSTKGWDKEIYSSNRPTQFGKEILFCFGYTERFRSNEKKGIWLAKHLNIKSCPYCNAQYTLVVTCKKGKSLAKFQFDHFYPKNEFPYLSTSLYNLIPACANCNITKSSKLLNLVHHYHPYYCDLSNFFSFRLRYNPDPKSLSLTNIRKENLEVEIVPKFPDPLGIVDAHNKLYHIDSIYNRHQDVAEDILVKAIIYSQHLIKSHLKIEGLFPDKSIYLKYLIGTNSSTKDLLNRPLTKYTQDIAKQLGLL